MAKRQVCCIITSEDHQPGMTEGPQNDEPTTFKKNKKANKCSSKVIELMEQHDILSVTNAPVDEPVSNVENTDDPPVTGRQRGAKNYTTEELALLNECMKAAVPIGPQGVTEAISLYKRVAKDRGWAVRGEKALRQKWDKVSEAHNHLFNKVLPA